MNKSKKLFARALYLVFALALVAGLTLVPAVAADSPADTDVGFEFSTKDGSDTVEWAAVPTDGLPTAGLGNYSVKLIRASSNQPIYVEFTPAAGTTLSDLEALTNDWSFWYHLVGTPSPAGPQLELKFTSGTDFVDITIMAAQASYATEDAWEEVVLADDLVKVGYWGSVIAWGEGPTLAEAIIAVLADSDFDVPGDWELTRVRAELYEALPNRNCHIDDITIDGTLYELEPIFLDAEYYSVGDTVEVTVPNFNVNTDPIRVNPVTAEEDGDAPHWWQVTVISDSDSVGITVDLEETGIDTGVFTGEFTTVGTSPEEDELYVQDGDEIKVGYIGDWGPGEQPLDAYTLASVDDTAPEITIVSPEDDAMTEEATPEIKATYTDDTSLIDEDSVEISVDGVDVTDDATTPAGSVTYTPEDDLAEGSHDVTVSVSDLAGNEATESWSFRIVSWLETDSVACDSELDALDAVGVAVSITGDTAKIEVGRYASNPEPDAALTFSTIEDGFFDVKVTACENNGDTLVATQVVIKFADAAITADSTAYVFDDLQGMWLACSDQGYNPTDEFLWVKVREADTTPNISELGGTPFAISGEAAGIKGDFDGDGDIDLVDFIQFAEAYGSVSTDPNYNVIGDFDDNGEIDLLDFVAFAGVYGT